jgi:small GTP-binding protein
MDHPKVKLLVVGDTGVGKTALIAQFVGVDKAFNGSCIATIGVDVQRRSVDIQGTVVDVEVWDTAGQERYAALASSFFKKAEGVIVAYDCSSPSSFERNAHIGVRFWLAQIKDYVSPDIPKVLVATKSDLQLVGEHVEGGRLARHHEMPFYVTSAWTNQNVDEVFISLASRALLNVPSSIHGLSLKLAEHEEKTCGC